MTITGDLKSKVDRVWDAFWSGGIANPLEVIEQVTYLLFMRRLDDLDTRAEQKARITGKPEPLRFGSGQQDMRWSVFKNDEPGLMFKIVGEKVFPFLRELGGDGSTYSEHMKDARFTIPTPALLSKVVDMLDAIPMEDRDTTGDLYEYLLAKIATAGVNGQFRTPRHIIRLMVDMVAPQPADEICDPACGTAGFLVTASEYLREQHPSIFTDGTQLKHFHHSMFHGYDFDATMLRVGSMNMLMHGIEAPDIRYRDSLAEGSSRDEGKYSLILANPPFAGSLDYESTAKDLQRVVKTKKTELLFLALFLRLLKPGGRAAVIVPDGVISGTTKAHQDLRRILVEDQKLDAVVKLPSGVFRPYAGVATAILFFTKTDSGGTEDVWFYDVQADGYSLDDRRNPVEASDLPDVLTRWQNRTTTERERARTDQSFCVPKADIVSQGYDLSINRYQEIVHDDVQLRPPLEDIGDIERLQDKIIQRLADLRANADRTSDIERWSRAPIGQAMVKRNGSVDPSKSPDESFDLYSIPAYDRRTPDVVTGAEIGSAKQIVEPGDVLLSKIVPHIRRAWIVGAANGRRLIASGEWMVFRSEAVDANWLRHLLLSDRFHREFMATVAGVGGSLLRARPAQVAQISIPIPPIEEQRRIAAVLDQLDTLRLDYLEAAERCSELLTSMRTRALAGMV